MSFFKIASKSFEIFGLLLYQNFHRDLSSLVTLIANSNVNVCSSKYNLSNISKPSTRGGCQLLRWWPRGGGGSEQGAAKTKWHMPNAATTRWAHAKDNTSLALAKHKRTATIWRQNERELFSSNL